MNIIESIKIKCENLDESTMLMITIGGTIVTILSIVISIYIYIKSKKKIS